MIETTAMTPEDIIAPPRDGEELVDLTPPPLAAQDAAQQAQTAPRRRGRPPKMAVPPSAPGQPAQVVNVSVPAQNVRAANTFQGQPGYFTDSLGTEIWEGTTEATYWVNVRDPLSGGWKKVHITGRRRLQISVEERRYNMELIPEENIQLDPFSNGAFICVQGDEAGKGITDDVLAGYLAIEDDQEFAALISGLESEVVLRRLLAMAEATSTVGRFTMVRDLVDVRYRVGGTQRTVQEMMEGGELSGFVR